MFTVPQLFLNLNIILKEVRFSTDQDSGPVDHNTLVKVLHQNKYSADVLVNKFGSYCFNNRQNLMEL